MKTIRPGHTYELDWFEHPGRHEKLQFIEKEPNGLPGDLKVVRNGTTNEEVLRVLSDRLHHLNDKFPCRENAIALTHIESALLWLEKRTVDRKARGVEGKHLQ